MKFKKVIRPRFEKFKAEASSLNGYFGDVIEYEQFDGTHCKYHHASYKGISDGWFGIFTEHNNSFMLHKEDVKWLKKNGKTVFTTDELTL